MSLLLQRRPAACSANPFTVMNLFAMMVRGEVAAQLHPQVPIQQG